MIKEIILKLDDGYYELGDDVRKIAECENIELIFKRHISSEGSQLVKRFYSDFYLDHIEFKRGKVIDSVFRSWLNSALPKNSKYEFPKLTIRSFHFNAEINNVQLVDYILGPNYNVQVGFPNLLVTGTVGGNLQKIAEFFNQNFKWKKTDLNEILNKSS